MLSSLTPLKKRTIFKVAVDLIKADGRIHGKEIRILDELQSELAISREDCDMSHYITLSEAVSSINEMSDEQAEYVIDLFNRIMRADSDVSDRENILLTAVSMACGRETREWARVISVPASETKVSDCQVVFLEKSWEKNAHMVFDDKYDNLLISKAFGDIGLQFFYLPSVLEGLGLNTRSAADFGAQWDLLRKSIGYLAPYGRRAPAENVEVALGDFDTATFFKVFLSALSLGPDMFPFNSFILVKVRDGAVFDDKDCSREVVDFLCIDMSQDIKKRILSFVSHFTEEAFVLPYEGYYKMFYDYISSESGIVSSVLVDSNLHFRMENADNAKVNFESSPQSRALYLLLLYYGQHGVSQSCFSDAVEYLKNLVADEFCGPDGHLNLNAFQSHLRALDTEWSLLIYNLISIYRAISTKDEQKPSYLSYIQSILNHRSSLKTYVNTGFSQVQGLASPEQYHITFDKEFNLYRVAASQSLFFVDCDGVRVPLRDSSFWKMLISCKI